MALSLLPSFMYNEFSQSEPVAPTPTPDEGDCVARKEPRLFHLRPTSNRGEGKSPILLQTSDEARPPGLPRPPRFFADTAYNNGLRSLSCESGAGAHLHSKLAVTYCIQLTVFGFAWSP